MSVASLRTQIKEDYLTCPICCNDFTKPKALPCIHTFCESCLRDYVVSRGHESAPTFPCPICRADCPMPLQGVEGFPNNHLMSSLSDTVEQSRPVPKPRRSLGVPIPSSDPTNSNPIVEKVKVKGEFETETTENLDEGTSVDYQHSYPNMHRAAVPSAPVSDDFDIIENQTGAHGAQHYVDNSPPPPYSSVADSKVCSKDDDPGWMFVPKQNPPLADQSNRDDFRPAQYPSIPQPSMTAPMSNEHKPPQPPVGWNQQVLPPATRQNEQPPLTDRTSHMDNSNSNAALYPSMPPATFESNTLCCENLILRFGKQGSTARDFIKPVGLCVSRDGQYIISDNGGDQNRIMIFNSGGEITTAFKCGAKVRDVAVTRKGEIVASIDKNVSAFRLFTMGGQLKGEFGKFFTFEKPGGIAELNDQGIVLAGTEGNCVYALTPQMKLSTKFGRKGNGDGYFLHPGFVTVDSKNHVIVTDQKNDYVQVFSAQGKFKQRFGSSGRKYGQLCQPLGVCVDSSDNIIVADSGNYRVEVFSPAGRWLTSIVKDTNQLGESVMPVNVAVTPTGKVAVLLRGPYFAEVRIYSSRHQQIPQDTHVSVAGVTIPPVLYNSINKILE